MSSEGERIAKVEQRCDDYDREFEHLNTKVFRGNGQPSLSERVTGLEKTMLVVTKLLWAVVGASVTALVGTVVKAFVKL